MRLPVCLSLLAIVACGGSSGGGGTTQDQVAILTITSGGIRTQTGGSATFSVPNPGMIQFVNHDSVAHAITVAAGSSADCNALNTGSIAAGASTANISVTNSTTANEVCSFSDSTNPSAAFTGSITILTTSTGGGGY
jgi:hypothetical protein